MGKVKIVILSIMAFLLLITFIGYLLATNIPSTVLILIHMDNENQIYTLLQGQDSPQYIRFDSIRDIPETTSLKILKVKTHPAAFQGISLNSTNNDEVVNWLKSINIKSYPNYEIGK